MCSVSCVMVSGDVLRDSKENPLFFLIIWANKVKVVQSKFKKCQGLILATVWWHSIKLKVTEGRARRQCGVHLYFKLRTSQNTRGYLKVIFEPYMVKMGCSFVTFAQSQQKKRCPPAISSLDHHNKKRGTK